MTALASPPSTSPSPASVSSNDTPSQMARSTVLEVAIVALAGVVALVASVPWARGFAAGSLVVHLMVAAAVGVGVPVVVVRLRRSFYVSLLVSMVGLLLYLLLAVVREPFGVGTAARGFADGGVELLSKTLPLGGSPALLVLPVVAAWCTAAAIGEVVSRSRVPGVPAMFAVIAFGGSYALTAGGIGDLVGWSVALFFAAGLLEFARRAERDASGPAARRAAEARSSGDDGVPGGWLAAAYGAASLLAVTVLCAAVVPRLPGLSGTPVTPNREPAEERREQLAPLADVARLRGQAAAGDNAEMLQVRIDQVNAGYLTLATLEDYDGDTWRLDQVFTPTGGRVPADGARLPDGRTNQQVEVRGTLPGGGAWLPYVSRPLQVGGIDVRFSGATGMVLPVEDVGPGTTYDVESAAPPAELTQLAPAGTTSTPPGAPVVRLDRSIRGAYTEVPTDLRRELARWAGELVGTDGGRLPEGSVDDLTRIVVALRDGDYARWDERAAASPSTTAAPTTSTTAEPSTTSSEGESTTTTAAPTTTVRKQPRNNGGTAFAEVAAAIGNGKAGTPEQFATLFVLVARSLGVPARVATGFRLSDLDRAPVKMAAGTYEVRAADAWTWAEVATRDQGWVPVDPTPSRVATGGDDVNRESQTGASSSTTTTAAPQSSTPITRGAAAPEVAGPRSTVVPPAELPWGLIGGGVLVLLLLSVAPVYQFVRRRRRQSGQPTAQAIGAWHEALDALDAGHVGDLDALTATEVVAVTQARFGDDAARSVGVIAGVANQALFLPAGVRADDATKAWSEVARLRSELRRSLPPHLAVLAWYRPGHGT